jgi:hypothetical protein
LIEEDTTIDKAQAIGYKRAHAENDESMEHLLALHSSKFKEKATVEFDDDED